jgi:hypothetical protein
MRGCDDAAGADGSDETVNVRASNYGQITLQPWSQPLRGSGLVMVEAVVLLVIVTSLLAMALLYMVAVGVVRLESRIGRMRDGFRPGTRIPPFRLVDLGGVQHSCPSGTSHQVLLFVHHAIRSFPTVTDAVDVIRNDDPSAEVLVLSISDANLTQASLRSIGLSVPLVVVQQQFYDRYRVEQMPFCIIVNADGMLLSSGNASSGDHVLTLWRRAGAFEGNPSRTAGLAPTTAFS